MTETMDGDGESQIQLTRIIEANVSDVFSAWTDPALIEQWQADEAEMDATEGGEYRFVTFGDDENPGPQVVTGEILKLVEDELLVMSWIYRDSEDEDSEELLFVLEVRFAAKGPDQTLVTLTERGLAHGDPQTRIFSMEAWSGTLATLAELFD